MLQTNERDIDRIVIEHVDVFSMINTRLFELDIDPCVLRS